MSDKVAGNSTSGVLTQSRGGHFENVHDRMSLWVSCCALLFSMLTFIFGNGIAWKLGGLSPFRQDNKTIIEGVIASLNVTLAVFVLVDLWLVHPVERSQDKSPPAVSFKQLLLGWQLLWATWIPFYGLLAATWFYHVSNDSFVWHVLNALNMVNGFFFYYLFFVLDQPSVPTESEPNRAKTFHRNVLITIILGVIVFVVSVFFHGKPTSAGGHGVLVDKLAPAYIAVGMAFFFGRLDSHYLRAHRVLLAPLYLYAVIQLFWGKESALKTDFDPERVTIFVLALILKLVIFITLSKWIRDGRFRRYFIVAKEGLEREL